jgi:hypothetical protein
MSDLNVTSLLRALLGCHLILGPDKPRFTVLEATDAFLNAVSLDRTIIGKGLLEVLFGQPIFYHPTDIANLNASLLWVLNQKSTHHMGILGHDLPSPPQDNFDKGIWNAINKPVLDNAGEVPYLIHTMEDVACQVGLLSSAEHAQNELAENNLRAERGLPLHT